MIAKFYQKIFATVTALLICSTLFANPSGNKTVLITGGLSGIGKDMALTFKNAGWNVWVTSRHPQKYEELAGIKARSLDITKQSSINKLMKEIQRTDGRIDVLINNAGYGIFGPQEAISTAQVKDLFNVNVIGPLQIIQAALPMMKAKRSGHIINISSTSGMRALPGLGTYAASKMALEGISEAFAAELAPWNIKVSIVEPGAVANEWSKNADLAENIDKFPGYKTFTEKLQTGLIVKAADMGQKSEEIAVMVFNIAQNPNPDMRYQTSKQSADLALDLLKDPSGDQMRDKMISFAKQYYEQAGINKE